MAVKVSLKNWQKAVLKKPFPICAMTLNSTAAPMMSPLLQETKRKGWFTCKTAEVIPGVLEAVIDVGVARYVPTKRTIHLQKDGYEAVLSLDEHGKKKTWLLTGYDIIEETGNAGKMLSGESGKVSARHAPTQSRPTFSRPEQGADSDLVKSLTRIIENTTNTVTKRNYFYNAGITN